MKCNSDINVNYHPINYLQGKYKCKLVHRRSFSTLNKNPNPGAERPPIPILVINLKDKDSILSYRDLLKDKGGIYSIFNTVNGNQYIGSAKDLYIRLNEHLNNKKSNIALQRAIEKYQLDKFNIYVYEYFTYESKIISSKALTDLETSYILKFKKSL